MLVSILVPLATNELEITTGRYRLQEGPFWEQDYVEKDEAACPSWKAWEPALPCSHQWALSQGKPRPDGKVWAVYPAEMALHYLLAVQ